VIGPNEVLLFFKCQNKGSHPSDQPISRSFPDFNYVKIPSDKVSDKFDMVLTGKLDRKPTKDLV
jgi:hypothetical protein